MKLTVNNPTSDHCFIGHHSHAGLDVKPVTKVFGPQEFDVPDELVGYFTRAIKSVLPAATLLVGDEPLQAQQAAEADAQAQAEAEAIAEAQAKAEAEAKAEAKAEAEASAEAKKKAKATRAGATSKQQE